MKIVADIKGELKKDDILIYDGNTFVPVNKKLFLVELNKKHKDLEAKYNELCNEYSNLKLAVNGKLKEYHDILQLLTKED